jgi:crotonobetaine/carnitine-CoA ligase
VSSFLATRSTGRGDIVGLLDDHGPEHLRWFLGSTHAGAVIAPMNIGFRGGLLEHVINLARVRTLLCGAEYVERLRGLRLPTLRTLVCTGDFASINLEWLPPDVEVVTPTVIDAADPLAAAPVSSHYWDPYGVIFTSGTTGPSKAVLCPYGQIHAVVKDNLLTTAERNDVLMVDVPMFHVSGLILLFTALSLGAQLVFFRRPSMATFLERVRAHGVTMCTLLGAPLFAAQPALEDDRENPLRSVVTAAPLAPELRQRFGITESWGFYNMSEINAPIQFDATQPTSLVRSVGRVRPGVEVRLVDDNDLEVPSGEPGQLVLRADRPWELSIGYLNDAEATAAAWRNGWFHTGDRLRIDEGGYYYFVDRIKDSIRRSGENISSFEVEAEVVAHPHVLECAAVAQAGGRRGEEVRVLIVPKPGCTVDPEELVVFLRERVPEYMLPRYVELVTELPKTENGKVRKSELRSRGLGADVWDREQRSDQ